MVPTGEHNKFLGSKSPSLGAPLGHLAFLLCVFCCAAFGRHCLADQIASFTPEALQKCCLSAACKPARPRRPLLAAVWAALCPSGVESCARLACFSASSSIRLVKSCYYLACLSVSLVCVCVCGCLCPCPVCSVCQLVTVLHTNCAIASLLLTTQQVVYSVGRLPARCSPPEGLCARVAIDAGRNVVLVVVVGLLFLFAFH